MFQLSSLLRQKTIAHFEFQSYAGAWHKAMTAFAENSPYLVILDYSEV